MPFRAAYAVPREGALFDAEHTLRAYAGPLAEALVACLAERDPQAAAVKTLAGTFSPADIRDAFAVWAQDGVVTDRQAASTWPAAHDHRALPTAVRFLGFDASAQVLLYAHLAASGVFPQEEAPRGVLLCADPAVAAVGEVTSDGRRWLLVRPVAARCWIGPEVGDGAASCARCLAVRLQANRRAYQFAQARGLSPILTSAPTLADKASLGPLFDRVYGWLEGRTRLHRGLRESTPMGARLHPVMPLAACPACGAAARVGPLDAFVSTLTGLVRPLVREPSPVQGLWSFHARAVPPVVPRALAALVRHDYLPAWGAGTSRALGRTSTLGEALERRSLCWSGEETVCRAPYRVLGAEALHPALLQGFSAAQQAHRPHPHLIPAPFDDTHEVWWMPVRRIGGSDTRLVPAAWALFGCPDPAKPFFRASSNGCAAGPTVEAAQLAGLLECIERDAAAIWWYNRLVRPGVDLAAFGHPLAQALVAETARLGRTLVALDLTHDLGVPVFVALSWCTKTPPRPLRGFGCHLDAGTALLHALREMGAHLPGAAAPDPAALRWSDAADPASDQHLHPDPARPLHAVAPPAPQPPPGEALGSLIGVLGAHGLDVLMLDRTRPDTGVPVVRMIVPGLREGERRLGPGRLYGVPVEMGWRDAATLEAWMHSISLLP